MFPQFFKDRETGAIYHALNQKEVVQLSAHCDPHELNKPADAPVIEPTKAEPTKDVEKPKATRKRARKAPKSKKPEE